MSLVLITCATYLISLTSSLNRTCSQVVVSNRGNVGHNTSSLRKDISKSKEHDKHIPLVPKEFSDFTDELRFSPA